MLKKRETYDAVDSSDMLGFIEGEESLNIDPNQHLRLSTGVVIKAKKIPKDVLLNWSLHIENAKPRPPTEYIESIDRTEENPDNPDYLLAMQKWQLDSVLKFRDLFFLLGVTVVDVPGTIPAVDDDEWIENLELIGIDVARDKKRERFLYWFRSVACVTDEDMSATIALVGRLSAIREGDVGTFMAGFRGDSKPKADNGSEA